MPVPHPEVEATVRLLSTAEGGRRTAILMNLREYRCPVGIDGDYFDALVVSVPPAPVSPGESAVVHMQFLSPELALPRLAPGVEITLWEGHTIATGCVLRLL